MTVRRHFEASESPAPSGSYSQAVEANGLLFLAGVGPYHPVTREVVGTTIEEQTEQVVKNVRAVLEAAGCGLQHVVNTTAYLADLERDWPGFDAVYGSFFAPPFPARTAVGATLKKMLVELSVVAVLPTKVPGSSQQPSSDGAQRFDAPSFGDGRPVTDGRGAQG